MNHDFADDDSDRFQPDETEDDPSAIVTNAPEEAFRLGYLDVICLVVNRMIGTGVFSSAGQVPDGTKSVGVSLLFWFAGILYSLAGVHVFIEYGLHVPRRVFEGVEQGIPRSGGELNYLQYVYRKPRYRKDTVLLSVCVFGMVFVVFGNVAGNCVSFAVRALQASNAEVTNGAVRGISIAIALFTCFIHTVSRRGGILLSNFLAIIKLAMLLMIIIAAIVAAARGFPNKRSFAGENFDSDNSFRNPSTEPYGYASAFLSVVFTFGGFTQPNYVLGEIAKPRRTFPIAMTTATALVGLLYMAVNLSYMSVVPKEDLKGSDMAQKFFMLTLGSASPGDDKLPRRVFDAFLAISSFGNIVVMTYTAARVKQEIAKEGILPYPKFFAQNTDLSLGRFLHWIRRKPAIFRPLSPILKLSWFAPEHHTEKTPVGALILHFVSCVLLLLVTWNQDPNHTYSFLSGVYTYTVHAFFGAAMAAGILYLRFNSREDWRHKAPGINPILSIIAAVLYLIGSLFPVIISWVKPSNSDAPGRLPWYLVPTLAWCAIAFGGLWWLGFIGIAKRIQQTRGTVFKLLREPTFVRDPPIDGPPIQVHETVYLAWVAMENEDFADRHTPTSSTFAPPLKMGV